MADEVPEFTIARRSRFTVKRYEDVGTPELGYLVKGVLPRAGLAFLVGPTQSGKSFLAIDWSLRIAAAMSVLGKRTKSGSVCYIAAEDAAGVEYRVSAWRQDHDGLDAQFDLVLTAPKLLDPEDMADLEATISELAAGRKFPLRCVVIDTFSQTLPGAEENTAKDMGPAMLSLANLGRALDSLIIIVAHTGKDVTRGLRGWSGIGAAADAVILIEEDEERPEEKKHAVVDKVKNAARGARYGFSLRQIALGTDEDGDPITSLVVDYGGESRRPSKAKAGAKLKGGAVYLAQAIERLREGAKLLSDPPPNDLPRWAKAVMVGELKREAGVCGLFADDDTDGNRRVKWHRAKTALVEAGRGRQIGAYFWTF